MAAKLILKKMPKPGQPLNGMGTFVPEGPGSHFIVLEVVAARDTRDRLTGETVTEVEIVAIEPLVAKGDRSVAEKMLTQARTLRRRMETVKTNEAEGAEPLTGLEDIG